MLGFNSVKTKMEPSGDTILVADDDPLIGKVLKDRLESMGYRVLMAATGKQVLEILNHEEPQMALLDIEMPDVNGIDVLKEIRSRERDFPVVMITAYGSIDRAVSAMKEGAYDFIPKPFKPDHIALIVKKAMERERLRRGIKILSDELGERHQLIVGKSKAMELAVECARKVATTKSTVLLLGESGTGKELFARAIHNWGDRRQYPFVVVNCVGLSKELLESDLFGHEKGAFTGAHQLKRGRMESAHGGTAFFDEIGDITAELQTKLLRFLQEREFERVGGGEAIRVDVKVIAATNLDLERAAREGRFRQDLYYRLNVVPIILPPLRERKEDIPVLATFFLQRFSKEAKKNFTEITQNALERLMAYNWPGNVRELGNVIERAVVLGRGPKIQLQDLAPAIAPDAPENRLLSLQYHDSIDAHRRELIMRALRQSQGNRAAAARVLGIQRTYLSRLIKTLRIC